MQVKNQHRCVYDNVFTNAS